MPQTCQFPKSANPPIVLNVPNVHMSQMYNMYQVYQLYQITSGPANLRYLEILLIPGKLSPFCSPFNVFIIILVFYFHHPDNAVPAHDDNRNHPLLVLEIEFLFRLTTSVSLSHEPLWPLINHSLIHTLNIRGYFSRIVANFKWYCRISLCLESRYLNVLIIHFCYSIQSTLPQCFSL